MACQCKGICSFMEPISRVNADSRESVHNGEVAFREVDELLGDRTQEMRIGPEMCIRDSAYMVVTASRMAVIDEQTAALEAAMRSESTWYCDIACSFASCSL